ncbi:MAG: DNA mismatch repair endonuclease MutL [Firmicutes bacterium]|nr:DNA mismatch repair endonuclease MutL [Bacillota bacterium]
MIERPASVLKELIENSLDAGCTQIDVDLLDGGFKLIRVRDNGWGMSEADLLMAVERHATSKIRSASDLWHIQTFGFRGEALPSIAAVSRLEIVSRENDSPSATRLSQEASQPLRIEPAGAPAGTTVTVRDIFYNTPARRKFQKSPAAENTAAVDLVTRLALANPQVAFRLRLGDRLALQTSGNNSLIEVIAGVYGADTARQMLPVGGDGVTGYISPPGLTRNNRQRQTFIVNRRYIHSRLLGFAVDDAYRGRVPGHRFPMVVLHLEIDPALLDVNVHPSKLEVRFREEAETRSLVQRALSRTLGVQRGISSLTPQRWTVWPSMEDLKGSIPDSEAGAAAPKAARPEGGEAIAFKWPDRVFEKTPAYPEAEPEEVALPAPAEDSLPSVPAEEAKVSVSSFHDLVLLGQLDNTYLVAEGGGDLYLIDQHAAHERILFEQIMDSLQDHPNWSQPLLFPEVVELSPDEKESLVQSILVFRELGFIVEDFGSGSLLLRSVPSIIGSDARETFLDLIGILGKTAPNARDGQLLERLAMKLSCRQAIKAGQKLERGEMEALLVSLEKARQPMSCPHGRPSAILFKKSDIYRRFFR